MAPLQQVGEQRPKIFSHARNLANKQGVKQSLEQQLENEHDSQKKLDIKKKLESLLGEITEIEKNLEAIPKSQPKLIDQNKVKKHSFLKATKLFISTFVNKHSKALTRGCFMIEVIGLIALSIILAVSFMLSLANPATYVAYLSSILVLSVVATLVHGGGIEFVIDKINAVKTQVVSAFSNKKWQYEAIKNGVEW